MTRARSGSQPAELEEFYRRCLLLFDFIARSGELEGEADGFRAAIEQTYHEHDLAGLRLVARDLEEWTEDLPEPDRAALRKQLQARMGVDVNEERRRALSQVDQIVRRGKIGNDEEYRLVLSRVEEIYSDPGHEGESRKLNELLAGYHHED